MSRIALTLTLAAAAALGLALGCDEKPGSETAAATAGSAEARLERAITVDGLFRHLHAFQAIADRNGGARDTGSPGYEESVQYVVEQLRQAGYEPKLEPFSYTSARELEPPRLERLSPQPAQFRLDEDFLGLRYSGSGDVRGRLQPIDVKGPTSGCEPSDFRDLVAAEIALVKRGGCFFYVKAQNARTAGAEALLVFNDGQPGHERPLSATLLEPAQLPVLGISHALGMELAGQAANQAVTVQLSSRTANVTARADNVVAELPGRRGGPAVLLGAHLDSVGNGPGINDNGTGSATVLETALQLKRLGIKPERPLRFAFWAAEELGLHGSSAYAKQLGADATAELLLALNFDMLGSPNFTRYVYDASGAPGGSEEIAEAFHSWFEAHRLAADAIPLAGRSDHAPFAAAGIPVGGLFSGADEVKPASEKADFGGQAGEPHDACYHQSCDTIENVSRDSLGPLADAAAAVALRLAGP